MPPLLVTIAADLGVPLGQIVQAGGVYFLVYGLSQPVWGLVAERIGRVPTMRLTLGFAGLSALAAAFAGSVLVLTLTRAAAGGFFGAAYPSTLVYLGDTVPRERRQRAIASLMVGVAGGTALAAAGAGVLADLTGWRVAFVITGTASLGLAWSLRTLPEPMRAGPMPRLTSATGTILRSRTTLLVLVLALAEGWVLLGALTLLPPALEGAGASAGVAGIDASAYGLGVLAVSPVVGRLSLRWHPAWLMAVGAGAALAACVVVAVSRAPTLGVVATVLIAVAWAALHSSLQTWATEVLPELRGLVVPLFAGALFVGSALGAAVMSGWAESGAYDRIFAAYALVAVPLGLVAVRQRWRWSPFDDDPAPRIHP